MKFKVLFFVLVTDLPSVYAGCDSVYPETPTFGSNCQYRCHCANDRKCSSSLPLAGCINDKCAHGWMGPFCQYRNIATSYVQALQQGENDDHKPELAVDGNSQTCSETHIGGYFGQQSWKVELDRAYRIVGMKIYVKENDLGTFRNFRIETGPSITSFPNACYEHPHAPATTVMEITCIKPVVTQHIRIILNADNVPLRLCEVEIYGGREVSFNKQTVQSSTYAKWLPGKAVDGRYPNANDANNAEQHMCSRTNGIENNPWLMVDLQTMFVLYDVSFFGRRLTAGESSGFYFSIGNTSTGTVDIFHDDPDDNDDPSRYQPLKTALTTPYMTKVVKVHMHSYSGTATLSVCEMHIFAECPRNRCGLDCEIICYCREEVTGPMKIEGICPTGCSERWTGQHKRCDTKCNEMRWGEECQNTCGSCMELLCDIVTGHCDYGCAGPLIPPLCVEGCRTGTFGRNCEKSCGKCVNATACDVTTGNCLHGCDTGWQGPLCDIACKEGKYGKGCEGTCGKCIYGTTCNPHTGHCDKGCHPAFYGDLCNKDANILRPIKNESKIILSSNYMNSEAERSLDGSFYADPVPCRCCAGTINGTESFWRIDMQSKYPIEKIIIYGRKMNTFHGGFDLILRNNTDEDGMTIYDNCHSVTQNNTCEIELKNQLAGSVEIRNPGRLTVCEVRIVEGVCQVGSFGDECKQRCRCADKGPCDRKTGACMAPICEIGFIGLACDQAAFSSCSLERMEFWLFVTSLSLAVMSGLQRHFY